MKIIFAFFFLSWLILPPVFSQKNTGEIDISINGEKFLLYKDSYALLIGISNYSNGWPVLPGVKEDLYKVRNALEKNGFAVMAIWDPDKDQMDDAITEFIRNFGQQQDTRLLIYFAGHGYTAKSSYGESIGYLVPVDAPRPQLGYGKFQARAMEMAQFDLYSKRIQSNHALFLFDACFSGSLFTSKVLPKPLSKEMMEPVRQFITSGSADEQVPDKSIFCRQFIHALTSAEGDYDQDGYITGTELGEFLQKSVINYSRDTQHPQYGKIRNPRLDKGEIIFITTTTPYLTTLTTPTTPTTSPPHRTTTRTTSTTPTTSPLVTTTSPPETTSPPPHITTSPPETTSLSPKPYTDNSGELKVVTKLTGDLYINDIFYRTIAGNSTVMLFNVPTGKQRLELKGASPWKKKIRITRGGVTVVWIK
ncbi:MAG: caspase family protein [Bacteroidales bacterium]|nr:caspase family protein [Bacteroidales bacterium]